MVKRVEIARALLEEIHEAAESLQDQIDSSDLIHITVEDVFTRHTHLECLMEVLKTYWNQSR